MLYVEIWAKNKPKMLAITAIQLVTFSDFLYEVLPQAKDRRLFGRQFPLPELTLWYRLYKTPLKPIIVFVEMLTTFCKEAESLLLLILIFRKIQKLLKRNPNHFRENPPSPEEVQEGNRILNEIYDNFFSGLKDDLDPKPVDPEEKARFNIFLEEHEQELGFFFFIFVPCLLIYQTSPNALYSKAVSGDIDAIEKLLKLDRLLQYEPAIGLQTEKLKLTNKTNQYERIKNAADNLAVTDHSNIEDARKHWKYELAAIISAFSKRTGKRYSSEQILKLFGAYAKDKDKGKQGLEDDLDLPAGNSFYKGISRHIQPWHDLFQNTDIKK